VDLADARWQTGPVADGRLVSGVPLEADGAVAAIERDGRLVAAVVVGEHYDGDCPWAGQHDRCDTYLEAWDLTAGTRITRIPGAGGEWVSLIVLQGRLQAIVANWAEPLRCWDIASGEDRVVVTPPGPVWTMAAGWHRARPVVLTEFLGTMTPSTGDAVIAWDLETGDEVERFTIPARGYPMAIVSRDGRWMRCQQVNDLAASASRLDDGEVVAQVKTSGREPSAICLSGQVLALAQPGVVELHDLAAGTELPPLNGQAGWARLAPATVHGRPHLVTASSELRLWDLTGQEPAGAPRHRSPIRAVTFALDGEEDLVITGDRAGTLRRWRSRDGQAVGGPLAHRADPVSCLVTAPVGQRSVLFSAGGDVSASQDGTLRRWDPRHGTPAGPPLNGGHNGESTCLAAARVDGRAIMLSGGNSGFLSAWDAVTGERIWHEATGRYPATGLAVGQVLGRPMALVSRVLLAPLYCLYLDDWSPAGLTTEGEYFYDRVRGLAETAAGPVLVTTDGDRDLRLWTLDATTWRGQVCRYEPASVTAVAVTSQPVAVIAAGYADSTVSFLNPATGDPLASPIRLPEPAGALAFGPSGELAACYGTDVALFSPAVPAAG
jgi:WD40 repeat protein